MTEARQPIIVAGLDLSNSSQNALRYAGKLCQYMGARLIAVHALNEPGGDPGVYSAVSDTIQSIKTTVIDENKGLEIELRIEHGNPTDVLLNICAECNADFAVVGATGTGMNRTSFVGSTAGELIKLGNVPILVIPGHCQFALLRDVLFAVKSPHVASLEVIAPFIALQGLFSARTTLLHIKKDSMPDLSRFPNPYLITPHADAIIESESDNIYMSVQSYFDENHVDLLVVVNRLRGFFEGLFAQGTSASFNSPLPILVLHGGSRDPFI